MAELKTTNGPNGTYATFVRWGREGAKPGDPMERADGMFNGPASVDTFREWWDKLSDGSEDSLTAGFSKETKDEAGNVITPNRLSDLTKYQALNLLLTGIETNLKQRMRPSPTVDNPWFSKDGVKINLFTGERRKIDGNVEMKPISVDKLVMTINMAYAQHAMTETQPPAYFETAKRLHVESGLYKLDKDQNLVPSGKKSAAAA